VTWGDGTTGEASVADDPFTSGKFDVFISPSVKSPPYSDEGTFPIGITVFDGTDRSATSSVNSATATVGESDSLTLHGVLIQATAGKPFSGTVATVTNAFTGTPAADFTALISWGDGTPNSVGVVSGSGGDFTVTSSHTYTTGGAFGASVGIHDDSSGTAFAGSVVGAHVVDPTTTGASSSVSPSVSGQSLVFTALVSHASGSAAPTGSVAFSDGSTPLGTVDLAAGTASFSTSTLAVGDHTITAGYSGDSNYAPSSGSTLQTVTAVPPAVLGALTISLDNISPTALVPKRGARVTFTLSRAATVTFTVRRKLGGRKVGHTCVTPTRSNRKKKRCSRLVTVSRFSRVGAVGSNSFHFTGRANGRPLSRGTYVLGAVATDATGKSSKPASRTFRTLK
jgi:hypothetical protein